MVVVLWDINNNTGYWSIPKQNLTALQLFERGARTVKLIFPKKNRFDTSACELLAKMARIDFYNTLLATARQSTVQSEREEKILGLPLRKNHGVSMNLVCFDFLRAIGFFTPEGRLPDHIGKRLLDEMVKELEIDRQTNDIQLCLRAVIIVLLSHVGDYGLPGPLFFDTAKFAASVILDRLEDHGLKNLRNLLTKKEGGERWSEVV